MNAQEKFVPNKNEMAMLNSNRAFRLLLSRPVPNYPEVITQMKYEDRVKELQIELIKLQNWVVERNKRVMIIFEGRDFAGKGGAISVFSEHLNPRNMRSVALPKPTVMQKRQWYFRRYIKEFPIPGEIVFFDRSWYNRAMVEPVNRFCSRNQYNKFMNEVNQFEEMIMNDGIELIKFYFSISKAELQRRLTEVKSNPLKKWQVSKLDHKAIDLWDQYTEYKEKMMEHTNRNNSPWVIIDADDVRKAHIKAMEYVLSHVMFKH